MTQKIFFGNVEIENIATREKRTVNRVVFKENEGTGSKFLRGRVLRDIKPKERGRYKITKLCFDTAKYLGNTIY